MTYIESYVSINSYKNIGSDEELKLTKEEESTFKKTRADIEKEGASNESLEAFDKQKETYAKLLMGTRISYAIVDSFWKSICEDEFLEADLEDAKLAYDNTAKFLFDRGLIKNKAKDYEGLNAMQVHMKIMNLYYSLGVDGELGNYVISEDSINEFYGFINISQKTFKKN